MPAFFAARRKLWAVGGLWGGALLAAFDVYAAIVTYIPQYAVRNDFRLMYGAALATERHGYAHLYDLGAQQAAIDSLGPQFYFSAFLNPPPLVWLVTPLTALPFGAAVIVWTVLILAAAALAWFLSAPGDPLTRAAFAAMFAGLFPVAFGIMVGQPVALVAAAVAACWWLAARDRDWLAGVALSVMVVKPQLALLVPVCLLVSGRVRIFAGWLIPSAVMGLVAVALLGADGLSRYRDALSLASNWQITRSFAVSGLVGTGPPLYVASAIALAAALFAAWRWRGHGVEIPIAAGITGSLLFTPYVGFQDFAMLVLAGWLVVRSQPNAWQIALLVVGYALLELCLLVQSVPILTGEVLLLASFIYWAPRRGATHSAPFAQTAPIEQAPNASFAQNVRN
ncbi:MAG TPA: glycosyltransferase family 87 protein [Candidatus Dormibacteraeota bacterium]|nr:glycosyltransferase family 87 protein [Candidatus Dormibacteraeota bacterium]